jgi:hypothetical protein
MLGVWPPTGFPDRPWLDDVDEDAFARSARSVCELYSEAVRPAHLPSRHGELRLFGRHEQGRRDALVTVFPDVTEGFEAAAVDLPDGVAELPPAARALLVLDVVHAAATRLGRERGWDEAVLEAARAHVVRSRLRYRWEGTPKASPDRRHSARPSYELLDDGYGRVVLQVYRRIGALLVAASPPALAFSTSAGFARSAGTLRWRSASVVELVPYEGLSAGRGRTAFWRDNHGRLTIDLDRPETFRAAPEFAPDLEGPTDRPAVSVQTPADAPPHIVVVGGGPVSDAVPEAYLDGLHAMLGQLGAPAWQVWWSGAGEHVLEIFYDFAAAAPGCTARRVKAGLRATIRRPAGTFAAMPAPARSAREDVDALLATVRRRTGLGPHPPLFEVNP